MPKLAILGAGGHGRVVGEIAEDCGWDVIKFFDDAWRPNTDNSHPDVVGNTETLIGSLSEYHGCFVALGNNRIRKEKCDLLRSEGFQIVTLVSPSSCISRSANLGDGVVVMPGAVVNAGAKLGDGTILNTQASVDHDCDVGEFCHISPGAHLAGGVTLGAGTWLGIGAVVRECIEVGTGVMIGANAAVVRNVPDGVTVIGVPAREVESC